MAVAVVLVVEDEPIQRMTMVDLVEEAGYEALEAWDADSAIAILERRPDVRVVLTDVDMPGGMDGMALAAAVRGRWPPIEIILISAGTAPSKDEIPARSIFLSKPVRDRDAVQSLRSMIADVEGNS